MHSGPCGTDRTGRRGRDSNPRWLITTLLFESSTLNRSDTSPLPDCIKATDALAIAMKEPPRRTAWYAWQDSNLRPLGPQPNALSPELQAHIGLGGTVVSVRGGKGGIRTLGRG